MGFDETSVVAMYVVRVWRGGGCKYELRVYFASFPQRAPPPRVPQFGTMAINGKLWGWKGLNAIGWD